MAVFVTCEECKHRYGYWLRRKAAGTGSAVYGIGTGSAARRSEQRAEELLRKRLETEHDPVPCPECGHYQPEMIRPAREERYGWLFKLGLISGVVVFVILACGGVGQSTRPRDRAGRAEAALTQLAYGLFCVVLLAIPVTAFGMKAYLCHKYQPNDDPEQNRIARGRSRAMRPKEYARVRAGNKPKPKHPPPDDDLPPLPMAAGDDDDE